MTAEDERWAWVDAGEPESDEQAPAKPIERLPDIASYQPTT